MRCRLLIAVVLVICLFISGCAPAEKAETESNVKAIVDKGVDIYSLDYEAVLEIGEDAIPVLSEMLDSSDKIERWACVKFLSAIGHELNAEDDVLPHIKKLLDDEDISIRVITAELVLSLGDDSGIPVLIDLLGSEEMMYPSEPPLPIGAKAYDVLKLYTEQDFETKEEWDNWWSEQ